MTVEMGKGLCHTKLKLGSIQCQNPRFASNEGNVDTSKWEFPLHADKGCMKSYQVYQRFQTQVKQCNDNQKDMTGSIAIMETNLSNLHMTSTKSKQAEKK